MKKFKILVIICILVISFNGCDWFEQNQMEDIDHIGCQEGEIDVDGNCLPSDNANIMLFEQDLDPYVDSLEINEDILGFLAKPKEPGDYPGIIMIHEWWGLNENIKEMAKILANEGYIVFAIDLYNGEVAENSDEARVLATSVRENPDAAVESMKKAVNYLKDQQEVSKIASLGWCFGGQQSLNLSLNEDLDATVIYYGQITDDKTQLKNIEGPVLGIFGAEDSSISVESVEAFEAALNELNIENDINIYPGVGHAFANPSGSNYAENETLDAWEKTVRFLDSKLKAEN